MQLHGPTADGGQHRSAAAGDVHGCIHIRELLPSLLEPRPVRFCDSSNILRRRGGRIRPMSRGQTRRALQCALVAIALSSQASFGQGPSPAAEDPFQRVRFLIGRWQGTTEGQPGKGTVARQYSTALNARFIRVTNRSTYPAQPANVKGEVHEDEGSSASIARARSSSSGSFTSRASSISTRKTLAPPLTGCRSRASRSRTFRRDGGRGRPTSSVARTRSMRFSSWRSLASRSRCTRRRGSDVSPERVDVSSSSQRVSTHPSPT